MKVTRFLVATLVGIFGLTSCSYFKKEESLTQADLKPVNINNEFSMDLPSYMSEAKNLNEAASLQYQNLFKEVYVIVIDEDKQEFIDTFTELNEYDSAKTPVVNYRIVQLKSLMEGIAVNAQTEPTALKINGLDAQQVQLDGNIQDIKHEISYFLTFVEGKDKLYMVMAWTLRDRKEKYSKMFDMVAGTFKQL